MTHVAGLGDAPLHPENLTVYIILSENPITSTSDARTPLATRPLCIKTKKDAAYGAI